MCLPHCCHRCVSPSFVAAMLPWVLHASLVRSCHLSHPHIDANWLLECTTISDAMAPGIHAHIPCVSPNVGVWYCRCCRWQGGPGSLAESQRRVCAHPQLSSRRRCKLCDVPHGRDAKRVRARPSRAPFLVTIPCDHSLPAM